MNTGIIIQARMGSTRLPGKIMKDFYHGARLIDVLLDNLHKVHDAKVIVATSTNADNDELQDYLEKKGELVFRGSENDVLKRFIDAADFYHVDRIVRICSDNPFMDWHGISELVEKSRSSEADYIGFRVNGMPSIKTHFGFWGEYVTLNALKKVQAMTEEGTPAHEHVTIHVYTNPDMFRCEWIECPPCVQGRDDIRLTIDTAEDLSNAKKVYSDLKSTNADFGIGDVVSYLDKHDDMKKSMAEIINKNKK